MTLSSIGGKQAAAIQSLVDLRTTLTDLQRQLSTGKKADTYAGLGLGRGVTVSLNSQLSAIDGYDATANSVMTRISVANTALSRMSDIAGSTKAAMLQGSYGVGAVGVAASQSAARLSLDELVSLLNTRAGDRYLFSGRATDTPAVETSDHIVNGDGTRAGLKQIISERRQADLGADGLGRLDITAPTASSVSVAEDAVSPFGYKLASITSTLTIGTVSGPTGSPAAVSVDLSAGNPSPGDTITLRFTLPDGSTENLDLTATTSSPPGDGAFTIGADPDATAANLQATLTKSIGKLASSSLTAASAVQASKEFFSADTNTPPPRVDGPPFDTATAMTTGTSANPVIWYTGEAGTDSARGTATAQIDPSLSVSYGMRANEDGLRTIIQSVATEAAITISSADPNAADLNTALNQRLGGALSGSPGTQNITDIQTEIADAQVSSNAAITRHTQQNATLNDYLDQIQGVSTEQVGAAILTFQTRLQASMQVTAMMYQTSLVNYMP
jgi:flagellin-like hook-associated protein FlgL